MLDQAPEHAERDDDIGAIGRKALFGTGSAGARKFALKDAPPVCDIVMKGGVTSGVVYPYAVMRLAQKFRLAGIGGTSAGAIAAALTAAAEYARQAKGDHESFSRFERWCIQLPAILSSLFQAHPRHRPIFGFATALMEALDPAPALTQRLKAFARLFHTAAGQITWSILAMSAAGGVLASARYVYHYGVRNGLGPATGHLNPGAAAAGVAAGTGLLYGVALLVLFAISLTRKQRWPMWLYLGLLVAAAGVSIEGNLGSVFAVIAPAALGGALGAVAMVVLWGDIVVGGLRKTDFGVCSGLTPQGGKTPALTDWLHAAIQDVAGRPGGPPLTFGDVEKAVPDGKGPRLALRMIVTNLTQRRPYALPDLGGEKGRVGWRPSEWRSLFPADVIAHMIALGKPGLTDDQVRPLPDGDKLPVVVGARMSLSFPVLFSAVPVYELTKRDAKPSGRMMIIDGGLSSNLPLHFFDHLGPPAHPTFAFNLQDDHSLRPHGSDSWWRNLVEASSARLRAPRTKQDMQKLTARRISLHGPRKRQPSLRRMPDGLFRQYLGSLLGAAKDWQDNLLSIMPGQFDRIVTIKLARGEGGLNLVMPKERSELLMQLGYLAGTELADNFDLQAHRVRRALAAYEEIERVAESFSRNWESAQLKDALESAVAPNDSRPAWKAGRIEIILRLEQLATWAKTLGDPLRHKGFPRPRGALRITPNLSGDI